MKALTTLAALAVLAAATHANVMHAGGYASDGAPLAIALSALLAVGIAFSTTTWRDGSKCLSAVLALCIVSGEVYWLFANAERELAAREAQEAPVLAARAKRKVANDRLQAAEAAKKAADDAAVSEAAKPGCAKNCASLLKDAKDRAERELDEARAVVAALPQEISSSPLAERIGIATWAWDLVLAGLRSLAVIGASVALALALHARQEPKIVKASDDEPKSEPVQSGSVSRYLIEALKPADGEQVPVSALVDGYKHWCDKVGAKPIERPKLVREIARLFDKAGLETKIENGKVYGLDVRLNS